MSTYSSIHYHITFSTKNRRRLIHSSWSERLHEYLGGTVRGLNGVALKIGGVEDHVHLLIGCKPIHRPSDLLREIKKASSVRIRDELGIQGFHWQDGYAIITAAQMQSKVFQVTLPTKLNIIGS